ncbi:MAG: hypothetical protein HWD59_06630 [Coxiellaceae bacterium]|nr:MAG: hypothetical protein HWD59_06630 [Coxiellaceae bacterium]
MGIVVILGLNHHRVQHFLIKIGGQEVSKHYRFFYLYNKDSLSPDNLLAAEPGYGFDDVYPLGLTAIDCKSKRFEEVYRQIKTSLRGKSQVKINQGRLEQLLSLFQESIHEGEEAVKTLLRTGIATSHINQYLQDYPSSQIDRNKLFHLLIPILTHFNKTGLRYDGQQKYY